jgi:hypothetical protein
MIMTADKGNSVVILPTQQYNTKIQNFIDKNNFQTSAVNPTKTFQNHIRKIINHSTTLITQDSKWKFINLNHSVPTIKGLINLRKPDQPIHPIVNWCNAPAYKLSKLFTLKIKQFTPLPYSFNIKNTTELIHELKQTPVTPTSTLASLDITNMCSNIPIIETKHILENMLTSKPTDPQIKAELLDWYEVITKQNYILNNDKIIIQTDGLAMGAPSSSIVSEIFLQHIEHTYLPCPAQKHKLINYFHFVNDILLIYDLQHTNIHTILNDFNYIHPNLVFTQETEQNNKIIT